MRVIIMSKANKDLRQHYVSLYHFIWHYKTKMIRFNVIKGHEMSMVLTGAFS